LSVSKAVSGLLRWGYFALPAGVVNLYTFAILLRSFELTEKGASRSQPQLLR
jgi:hypothetical protein